jgi:hypothetical protein
MNKHFVNIKMDREERPDVDKVYMTFVQVFIKLTFLQYFFNLMHRKEKLERDFT